MPRANLTDLFIRKIAPDERTIYWDEALPAFGVRVGARSKVFIVIRGQARKKTTIGKYQVRDPPLRCIGCGRG